MAEKQRQEDVVRLVVELDEQEIEAAAKDAQDKINQRLRTSDSGRVLPPQVKSEKPPKPAEDPSRQQKQDQAKSGAEALGRVLSERFGGILARAFNQLGLGRAFQGLGQLAGGFGRTVAGGLGRMFGGLGGGAVPPAIPGGGAGAGGAAGGGAAAASSGLLRLAGAVGLAIAAFKGFSLFMDAKVAELGRWSPQTMNQQARFNLESMKYDRERAKAWTGAMSEWVQAKRDWLQITSGLRLTFNSMLAGVSKTVIRGIRGFSNPGLWVQPLKEGPVSSFTSNASANTAFSDSMRIDGRLGRGVVPPGSGSSQAAGGSAPQQPVYRMPEPQSPTVENHLRYDANYNIQDRQSVLNAVEQFRAHLLRGINDARDQTRMMADLLDGRIAANLF